MALYIIGGVVLVLAFFVAVLYAMGKSLPVDHVVTATLHLNKPAHDVHSLLENIQGWQSWDRGISKMVALEPVDGHPRTRMHMGRNSFVLTLTKSHTPTVLSLQAVDDRKFFEGRWDYHISHEGAGVKIKLTEYGKVFPAIPRVFLKYGADPAMYLKRHLKALAGHFGEDPRLSDARRIS